jgi:hypothetical protein
MTLPPPKVCELIRKLHAMLGSPSDIEDGSAAPRSKTDQEGAGAVRWLSPRTTAALRAWLDCAGIATDPVFRAVSKNGVAKPACMRTFYPDFAAVRK